MTLHKARKLIEMFKGSKHFIKLRHYREESILEAIVYGFQLNNDEAKSYYEQYDELGAEIVKVVEDYVKTEDQRAKGGNDA